MFMLNRRTSGGADGRGTQVRRGGSIARESNGYSDFEYAEHYSALTPAFPIPGQIIPSVFDIIRPPTKLRWKIPEVFPAALPEWNMTANRFRVLPTFHCQTMASNIISSSFLADGASFFRLTPN